MVKRGANYDFYDESCKRYKTLGENIGKFVSVAGDTFVIRKNSLLETYDRFGKKISSRYAR